MKSETVFVAALALGLFSCLLGYCEDDSSVEIRLGRTFVENGFTKENLNFHSETENSGTSGVLWTGWRCGGYLCQVDAALKIRPDGRFDLELRMENIGNNPFYYVSPLRERGYLQMVMTDGLQSFPPAAANAIAILPAEDFEVELPQYKLCDENGLELTDIRLIPKHDNYKDFEDAYHEVHRKSRMPARHVAILTVSHPEFRTEKIRDWEYFVLILYLAKQFHFGPYVAPEGDSSQRKLIFCVPDFKKCEK